MDSTPPVNRKLEIARALAAKAFAVKKEEKVVETEAVADNGKATIRGPGTGEIIRNPDYSDIYSMQLERKYVTRSNLNKISAEMTKMSLHSTVSVRSLVRTLRDCLKASFFGCEVNIGISPDSALTVLDFLGDEDYKRRVQRGQSPCFDCLDQGDIVLQVASVSTSTKSDKPNLTSGETVIYVPLIGSAGGLGVIEIHGLRSPSLTNTKNFQRNADLVISLIQAKDYSFMKHTRLWRQPSSRSGGEVSPLDHKDYGKAAFPVVQGKVVAAVTELHGVPFFGGARFNLVWEDGLVEEAVPANNFIEVYRNTPQSLGCTSEVTEDLMDDLMRYAKEAAGIIEHQRTVEALKRTQDSVNVPNLRDMDICERCLSSLLGIVRGMREACLVGFEKVNLEDVENEKTFKIHLLQRKHPKVKVITRGLNRNPVSITEQFVLERDMLLKGINPRPVKKSRSLFRDRDDDDAKIIEERLAAPVTVFADLTQDEIKFEKRRDTKVEWAVIELMLPPYYRWPQRVSCSRFFVVVLQEKNSNVQARLSDLHSIESVSKILKTSFTISCEKDMRKKQRRQAMLVVDRSLYEWRDLASPKEICDNILSIVSDVAPGTNSYAGMLIPGGNRMEYIAASENSSMMGNVLLDSEGVAFSVIDHLDTVIVREGQTDKRKLIKVGDYVNVQYGKICDRARIRKDRGHGFYDVEYGPESYFPREAGVPLDRIMPLVTSFRMKAYGEFKFPVMNLPVKHRDKMIGVIGMDTFDGVLHAPYDPQPEPGLKLFLEHLGKVLGSCVDIQRKKKSLRIAAKVARNPNAANNELFAAMFEIIFTNLLYTSTTALVNVTTEEGGIARDMDTIDVLAQRGDQLTKDARATLATYDSIRSSKKPVQFKGDKTAWIVCRIKIPVASASKTDGKKKKKGGFRNKDYILCIICSRPITEVDTEFLHAVQKFATLILQNIETRKQKAQIRTEALQIIDDACRNWKDYVDCREDLFEEVCDAINSCYMSANVYIAQLQAHADVLEYTYASKFSKMKGKKLLRNDPHGVSFRAIDRFTHVSCTKSDHETIKSLHHYGNPANFDYPFVVVPLAAYLDAPLGVMAADACEDMTEDDGASGSVNEIISFFYSVAGHVGRPIKSFLVYDSIDELYHIQESVKSHWEGFRGVKSVLSNLLPYVGAITEVELSAPPLIENDDRETTSGMVFIIRLIEATCLPPSVMSPVVTFQWRGMPIFSCPCGSSELDDEKTAPVTIIRIPKGVKFNDVEMRILLRGQVNAVNRDVGRMSIGLLEMMNYGALLYEHDLQCIYTPLPDVHAGTVQFVSKLYSASDVVRLIFQTISCAQVMGTGPDVADDVCVDPYCIVRWKGVEIARTEPARNTFNPTWRDLNIVVKPSAQDLSDGAPLLCIEMWDTDALDRAVLLGMKQLSVLELKEYGSSRTWPLEVVADDPVKKDLKHRKKTGAELRFVMSLVCAEDISDEVAREELAIPFLSSAIKAIKAKEEGDGGEEAVNKMRECVLHLHGIKNLKLYLPDLLDNARMAPGELEPTHIHPLNPFCILYLNGDEVGRTSASRLKGMCGSSSPEQTINEVTNAGDVEEKCDRIDEEAVLVTHSVDAEYVWNEEVIHIAIPNAVELDVCSLRIEVYAQDSQQKGIHFGSLVISEKTFTSLLCGTTPKMRWYDVLSLSKVARGPYMCGELLLAGHPASMKVNEDIISELTTALYPPLSVRSTAYHLDAAFWSDINSTGFDQHYTFEVNWNGFPVIRKEFSRDVCVIEDGAVKVDVSTEECAPFNRPHDILLRDSVIQVDLIARSASAHGDVQVLARGVIDGDLVEDYMSKPLRRNILCELRRVDEILDPAKWCEVTPGSGSKVGSILLNLGPAGEDDAVETDGRTLWLDILGASGLVSPAYTELRRPNAFCKVFWNESFIGQTAVAWNATDPMWSKHRLQLPVPLIDIVDESLELCLLRIEVWNVASRSANAPLDFLGCFDMSGEELQQVVRVMKPPVRWHALEMHSDMPTEEQQYVCSRKGAVKIRLSYGSRVVNEKAVNDTTGGEYFIRVNAAMTLKQVDNFSKTNAFVIVYWNNNEIGRTEVIEKDLNPVYSDEVFLLRVPEEEYLRHQKLQLHAYDYVGGSTGDLLGQTLIFEGDQLVSYLHDIFDNSHVFPLLPDTELTDDENKFVGGSLSVSFLEIKVAPVNDPVVLYSDAYINIQSAVDIFVSNFFDQCADPTCVLYWYSLFDSPEEKVIGCTEPMWKTTNPVWKMHKIAVKIPVIDEWSSIFVRIDVLDVASPTEVTFLGSCTLTGWNLKKVLERTGSAANEAVTFNLVNVIRFHDAVKHSILYAPKPILDVEETRCGSILVTGGVLSGEDCSLMDGNESIDLTGSIGAEEKKDGDNRSIVSKKSDTSWTVSEAEKKAEKIAQGNKVDIRVQSINSLTIPIELESVREDMRRSEYIYFVAKFNDKVAKKMFVKGEEKVSTDILNISYAIGDAVSFMFFLPVDNDPSTCTMEIEVWISENRLHETEGQSANDLFLGYAELQGTDLVQLLRPKAEEKTFPLKSKTKSEVRSSVNRNVRGASITIKGRVPDLVRTLSSKKIAKGGGSSNWRNASQANLKLPSSVETIDPMLKKETFQIHLCEAGGLSKGASLMGGFSDMYAVVYWRGESLGTTEKMKSQASAIVNKDGSPTCEVVWENEVFILTKPEGERITECSLTIEIFEKKSLGGSVFLGCVNWEEDLLLEFLHVKEPSWHKLLTSYSKPMDEQRRVQGKLFIGAKCLDDQAVSGVKVGGWEFDPSVPLKDDMKDVEFSVLAASGLGKADKFGKSDPFCVVKWNGVEIGKSEVVKKSLDPVWEEANFVIRTPKNLGPLADSTLKGTSTDNVLTKRRSFVAPGGVAETIDLAPARGRDRRRVAVPISALSQNVFTSRTDCELSVEVWDWNASGNSVFLGCVELKGPELASFMDVKDMKRQSFTLTTTKKMSKNSQKLVKGSIVFLLSPMPSEKEAFMGRDIELEISAARSLQKADRFGLADPYCVVRWNHKVAGKTNVVKNSLNPLWRNEIFQIRTRGTDSLKMCLLYIEIWDQTMNGKGNFLGCFELTGQDLEQLVENNDLVWHTLKPSPYLSKAVQSLKPTGELQFRLGLSGTTGGAASNIASFELAVMCAENIAPTSFFGDVDSFCVVKSNGKEMGTTAVITKNNNPRWSGERFVVSMHTHVDPDTEETSSSTVVSIEMWSMLALGRGDFLGGVTLTYADLVRLAEDCMSTKRAAFTWHDLQKSPALPDSKQKHIQGRLRLGCKNFGSTSVEEIGLSGESEVKVLWPTPPPTVPGTSIGLPSFELCILSCADLVVPTKNKKKYVVPDPFCLVNVNGEESGMTTVCPNTCNPTWSNDEKISIRIPENVDQKAFTVSIEVYNMDGISKGEFLGRVVFSFWSLFCLQNGIFTFHLTPHVQNPDQYIKATITFGLELYQPRWCNVRAYESPGITRCVSVISGRALPDVNGLPPTTRVTIVVEGGIRARSSTVSTSVNPAWHSPATCQLSLDYRKLVKIVLQVLFVDAKDNREICIGEVVIPHEFLLRPPADAFELWLTPPSKNPPKSFDFVVDGSLTITLTGGGANSETLWTPWASRSPEPILGYEVEEVAEVVQSSLYVGKEKRLTIEECEWVGTSTVFSSANVLPTKEEWLLLPLRGMGVIVDHQIVGTHPLKQYCMCIKRRSDKSMRSDTVMIAELQEALQSCLIHTQRRDIYKYIRNRSLDRLKTYFENMIRNNTFSLNAVFSRIARVMKISFPGATFFISMVSKDFTHMKYSIYESSMDTDDDPLFFTLWDGQGLEWECVGPHSFRRDIIDVHGLKPERLSHIIPISFCRFQQFRTPRICSPLRSGDAAMGVLGLENFDILKAGAYADLADLNSIKQWLSDAADLCGDVLYTGRERKVLKFLESYVLFSSSSSKGLIRITLEHGLSVLQGCRLMEIWSHDGGMLKSVATSWPESPPPPSRWIILSNIHVKFVLKSEERKSNVISAAMANFFFRKKKSDVVASRSLSSGDNAAQIEAEPVDRGVPVGYILGIYYGGFEQYQFVSYFKTKKETEDTFDHTFRDIKLFLSNDRNISLCLYCVDEKLTILDQYAGLFQLVTLKEKSVSVPMLRGMKSSNHFLFTSSVAWPSAATKAAQHTVAVKALKNIEKFTLRIHRAFGLTKTDIVGSSDPFCEVYWCDKLIGKTLVVQDSLDPEWDEEFEFPAVVEGEGVDYICRIEVWDMGFLGKDSFLGEFEIQLDQLLLPPVSDIEVQLHTKNSLPKAKNQHVGGSLEVSYAVMKKDVADNDVLATSAPGKGDSDDDSEDGNQRGGKYPLSGLERRTVEKYMDLDDPVIRLSVERAEGLAKADLLGLSDPYVKVYRIDNAQKDRDCDPVAMTRVIEKTLNPVWNEDLIVALNIASKQNKEIGLSASSSRGTKKKANQKGIGLLDDWPILILEVWDKDNVNEGTFLGEITLTPPQYALARIHHEDLHKSKERNDKQNKYVQGSIHVRFLVQENTEKTSFQKFLFGPNRTLHLSTLVHVSIVSAKNVAKLTKGFKKKVTNPYCILRWKKEKVGETAIKKNSVDPTWANEKFTFDISQALVDFKWTNLTIEMWSKQGDIMDESINFLGEVHVSFLDMLHPSQGVTLKKELYTKPNVETGDGPKPTGGVLTIRISRSHVPQRVTVKYKEVRTYPIDIRSHNHEDNIESQYSNDKVRVVTSDPIPLEIVLDPDAERRRQRYERLDLPQLLNKYESLNERYLKSPFDQIGLISELHFGQTTNAFENNVSTVLHIGEGDMHLMPALVPQVDMTTEITSYEAEFVQEVVSDVDDEGNGDMLLEPPKEQIHVKREGDMCLVCRYPKHMIPRRDMTFLASLRDTMIKSLTLFEQREKRIKEREIVLDKIVQMHANSKRYTLEDIILTALRDVEYLFNCSVDIYLLQSGGQSASERIYLMPCSQETGYIDDNVMPGDVSEFVKMCAKVCRHNIMLQCYRGDCSVLGMDWKKEFSQSSVVPLDCIADDISVVEGRGLCHKLTTEALDAAGMGACAIPLMLGSEVMLGMMVLSGTDKLPHSIYRREKKLEGMKGSSQHADRTAAGSRIAEQDLEVQEMFEEGTSDCMRNLGSVLGPAIFAANMDSAIKDVKTFPVRDDTDPEDVIRYTFRRLLESVPVLVEVSVWKVWVMPESNELSSIEKAADATAAEKKDSGQGFFSMFKRRPVAEVEELPSDNPAVVVDGVLEMLEQQASFVQLEQERKATEINEEKVKIEAGFFKTEAGTDILTTGNEKILYQQLYEIESDGPPASASGRRQSQLIRDSNKSKRKSMLIHNGDAQKHRNAVSTAGAQVQFAISRHEYSRVVPWVTDTPSSLKKEAFAGITMMRKELGLVSSDSDQSSISSKSDYDDSDFGSKNGDGRNDDDLSAAGKSLGDSDSLVSKGEKNDVVSQLSLGSPPKSLTKTSSFFGKTASKLKLGSKVFGSISSLFVDTGDLASLQSSLAAMEDPCVVAHKEICRCVDTLDMKSFHIGTGGGIYLTMIERKSDGVVDKIFAKRFLQPSSEPIEIVTKPDITIAQSGSRDGSNMSDDPEEILISGETDTKKKTRPGASNVKTVDSLVPRSQAKGPPPQIAAPPPPPKSLRPDKRGGKDKKPAKDREKAPKKGNNKQKVDAKPSPEVAPKEPRYEYFFAVKTDGVGGEMGWGVIGETLSTKIDLLVQTMHFVLAKVVAAKVKSGKDAAGLVSKKLPSTNQA